MLEATVRHPGKDPAPYFGRATRAPRQRRGVTGRPRNPPPFSRLPHGRPRPDYRAPRSAGSVKAMVRITAAGWTLGIGRRDRPSGGSGQRGSKELCFPDAPSFASRPTAVRAMRLAPAGQRPAAVPARRRQGQRHDRRPARLAIRHALIERRAMMGARQRSPRRDAGRRGQDARGSSKGGPLWRRRARGRERACAACCFESHSLTRAALVTSAQRRDDLTTSRRPWFRGRSGSGSSACLIARRVSERA